MNYLPTEGRRKRMETCSGEEQENEGNELMKRKMCKETPRSSKE